MSDWKLESSEAGWQLTSKDLQLAFADADQLLRHYVATAETSPEMAGLKLLRDVLLDDLDEIDSAAQITGLVVWFLAEQGIEYRGQLFGELAEHLGDLDLDEPREGYAEAIFLLRRAEQRLDEIAFDELEA